MWLRYRSSSDVDFEVNISFVLVHIPDAHTYIHTEIYTDIYMCIIEKTLISLFNKSSLFIIGPSSRVPTR